MGQPVSRLCGGGPGRARLLRGSTRCSGRVHPMQWASSPGLLPVAPAAHGRPRGPEQLGEVIGRRSAAV